MIPPILSRETATRPGIYRARHLLIDLLRRPHSTNNIDRWSTALTVDPQAQLREVAQLVEQGLVSPGEFDAQRRKVSEG